MRPCGKCGLNVQWVRSGTKPDGNPRWKCVNPDGTEHWDTCSQERTRRVKAEGTPFTDEHGDGYIYNGKKVYMHMVARSR